MSQHTPDEIKLKIPTFNFNFETSEAAQKAKSKARETNKRTLAANETLADARIRLLALNNSDAEINMIERTISALVTGEVTRDPAKLGKALSKAEIKTLYPVIKALLRKEKLDEMVKNIPDNFILVNTPDTWKTFLEALYQNKMTAWDTETTGLDVIYGTDTIVGISCTLPDQDLHHYIPLAHECGGNMDLETVIAGIKPYLENAEFHKTFHNFKFDYHVFKNIGIHVRGMVHDTQVGMHILNENENDISLKGLATKLLVEPSDGFDELFGKDYCYAKLDLDVALAYAAKDTFLTWKLYRYQIHYYEKLPKLYEYYSRVENPLIEVLAEMERTGFTLDMTYADTFKTELAADIERLEIELRKYFGDINLNSSHQLKPVLEKIVGRKLESTDAKKVLKPLKDEYVEIATLLEYKEATKMRGTYVESLPKAIKSDGRIHPSFGQTNTVTGRLNSARPNFQNQPPSARKLFIAPPGKVILAADFSSQEPRLLAHYTQEPVMLQAFKEGKDLYAVLASKIFKKPYEQCGDGTKERKACKVLLLAIMYGISAKGVASSIGISAKEAQKIIDEFYVENPMVKKWMADVVAFTKKNRYTEMLGGRKRRLPDINSSERWIRARNERQAINAMVQGAASIQTKLTMIKMYELCKKKNWQFLFSIHDEVAVIVPDDITQDEVDEFENVMLSSVKLSVPNKSDIEFSLRWGCGISVDDWFNGVRKTK